MIIAVLSGKGGTGKTTVSTCLAASVTTCRYIDCDVEEPNGAIFLNPEIRKSLPVKVSIPKVDMAKCIGCGNCGKACQYNAIAVVKGKVIIFPELCHHCGACMLTCPNNAIGEEDRVIGIIEANEDETFLQGRLNVGEPVGIPIINELKKYLKRDMPSILDCSPGASCAVVRSIEGSDYCILVTEPTPFGLHDLKIAVRLVRIMGIPHGVVVNKVSADSSIIQDFCRGEGVEVLMELPFSRELAEAYSKGIIPVHHDSAWKERFAGLYRKAERGAGK